MHGGLLHLGGNMLYLWIFGDNVEDSMGPVRFTLFYLACGVAATLTHIAIDPSSVTPLVGASGAIAGVLAAYLMLYPHAEVRVMIVILIFVRWASFPAVAVLAGWLIIQFLSAPASLSSDGGGVAYFAHIGGFVAGLILTPFMRLSGHPIFPAKEKETNESNRLTVLSRPVSRANATSTNKKPKTDHIRRSRRHLPNVKSSHRKQDEDK